MYGFFPLVVGALGSLHCLGMCGPLVLAYSLHLKRGASGHSPSGRFPWKTASFHHLAFHGGRLLTYSLLGALAAGLFQAADLSRFFSLFRQGILLVSGVIMILLALVLFKVLPLPASLTRFPSSSFLGARLQGLFRSRSPFSAILLGMATGTVPCCLSWAMIVTAATTRNPIDGFTTMAIFGLGTVPALFIAGWSASALSWKIRFLGERLAALLVLAMGIFFMLKGVKILE